MVQKSLRLYCRSRSLGWSISCGLVWISHDRLFLTNLVHWSLKHPPSNLLWSRRLYHFPSRTEPSHPKWWSSSWCRYLLWTCYSLPCSHLWEVPCFSAYSPFKNWRSHCLDEGRHLSKVLSSEEFWEIVWNHNLRWKGCSSLGALRISSSLQLSS